MAHTNQAGYEQAVGFLTRMRPLAHRLGDQVAFGREAAELRTDQRRKRNLVRLLDSLDWPEVPRADA